MKAKQLVCATALALAAGSAQALLLTRSATQPPEITDWFNLGVAIQQFDPALGTVTSATISLSGLMEGSVQIENLNNSPMTGTLDYGVTITSRHLS